MAEACEATPELAGYLRDLHAAVANEDLRLLEHTAAALKGVATQSQLREVADHAMRVQLAARTKDLRQVAAAVQRLHYASRVDHSPAAATSTSLFSGGKDDDEVSDC